MSTVFITALAYLFGVLIGTFITDDWGLLINTSLHVLAFATILHWVL